MILGSLSLILWSLFLLATVKGVLLLLGADNQGEGGHFSLYALVRGRGRWLLLPAALGSTALFVNSVLTPALTLTAAAEGIRSLSFGAFNSPGIRGILILAVIMLSVLFYFQGLGSQRPGRFLGPIMLVWFVFIGSAGALHLSGDSPVWRAFDPRLGVSFLFSSENALGFALLGLVFLSVTGTEILYANLDFAGRKTITRVWPFVLLCICLSYLGQGAWLIKELGSPVENTPGAIEPFFQMLPYVFRLPALFLALAAAWATSQTMLNGSFSLVSEAIRFNLLPALEIRYLSDAIRQEYIPSVNFLMWFFCCAAVIVFQSGQRMASAYGLTAAISMLTTTIMLYVYSFTKRSGGWPVRCVLIFFGVLEAFFLVASLEKLQTGGIVVLLLTLLLLFAMLSWNQGEAIEKRFSSRLQLRTYLSQLEALRSDDGFQKLADNLVYFDNSEETETVDQAILYSILDRGPKRAKTYWFVTVNTVSEPYLQNYRIETFETECVFRLQIDLGYKCSRPLTRYLRDVFLDMERQCLVPSNRKSYLLSRESALGTIRYCILRRRTPGAEQLTIPELWVMRMRNILRDLAGFREEWYTEEDTDVTVERIPLSLLKESSEIRIQRLIKEPVTSVSSEKGE